MPKAWDGFLYLDASWLELCFHLCCATEQWLMARQRSLNLTEQAKACNGVRYRRKERMGEMNEPNHLSGGLQ